MPISSALDPRAFLQIARTRPLVYKAIFTRRDVRAIHVLARSVATMSCTEF